MNEGSFGAEALAIRHLDDDPPSKTCRDLTLLRGRKKDP